VLPPRSPKLNGQVERAHRSHVQEFYDYYVGELSIEAVKRALRAWEETFNTLRPHRAESPKATARSVILRPSTRTGCPTVSSVLNPYMPGDILVGDDGVIVIPRAIARHAAELAAEQEQLEAYIRERVGAGTPLTEAYPPSDAFLAEYRARQTRTG